MFQIDSFDAFSKPKCTCFNSVVVNNLRTKKDPHQRQKLSSTVIRRCRQIRLLSHSTDFYRRVSLTSWSQACTNNRSLKAPQSHRKSFDILALYKSDYYYYYYYRLAPKHAFMV